MGECIPFKSPGSAFTGRCVGAVTGKRFIKIVGDRTGGGGSGAAGSLVGTAGLSNDVQNLYRIGLCSVSGERAVGVAKRDAADTTPVGFFAARHGYVLPVTAGEELTWGQDVQTNAEGKAIAVVETAASKALLAFGAGTSKVRAVAKEFGDEGNYIELAFIDPGGVSATLGVVVSGKKITVNLGRAFSAINSTAAAVIAKINETEAAAALVVADNGTTGETTGAGLVAAHAVERLAGGADTGKGIALGQCLTTVASGKDAEILFF